MLYVGKAKNIRSRVASYFTRSGDGRPKVAELRGRVRQIDFIATRTETEALVLEANLIKRNRPRFNASLRDDKSYPYIVVTLGDEYPRVFATRCPRPAPPLLRAVPERGERPRDVRRAQQDVPVPQVPGSRAGSQKRGALPELPHRALGRAVHRGSYQGGVRRIIADVIAFLEEGRRSDPREKPRCARPPGIWTSSGRRSCATSSRPSPRPRSPAGDHRLRGLVRRGGSARRGRVGVRPDLRRARRPDREPRLFSWTTTARPRPTAWRSLSSAVLRHRRRPPRGARAGGGT